MTAKVFDYFFSLLCRTGRLGHRYHVQLVITVSGDGFYIYLAFLGHKIEIVTTAHFHRVLGDKDGLGIFPVFESRLGTA
tara:strand:+ start:451 stop:687 length:237 start_codon:yes stop_codon:yes gene_type:complete